MATKTDVEDRTTDDDQSPGLTNSEKEARKARETEANLQETALGRVGKSVDDGPVVLHGRTSTDENFYAQFGSKEEAVEFEGKLYGPFDFTINPLVDPDEWLEQFPQPEEPEPEVNPTETVAQRSGRERPSAGIPDHGTLEASSRADLDVIAADNGLDPEDYRNKDEIVAALDKARS